MRFRIGSAAQYGDFLPATLLRIGELSKDSLLPTASVFPPNETIR